MMKMTSSAIRSACKLARMATVSINPVTLSHPVVLGGKIINKKENQARVHAPALKTRIKMDPFVRVPKRRVRVCIYIYLCVLYVCVQLHECVCVCVVSFAALQWLSECTRDKTHTYITCEDHDTHNKFTNTHTHTHFHGLPSDRCRLCASNSKITQKTPHDTGCVARILPFHCRPAQK